MIVADTHVWLWMNDDPDRLSEKARVALAHTDGVIVSPISAWELSTIVAKGRLDLGRPVIEWVRTALAVDRMVLAPLPAEVAVAAGELGKQGFHGDPADRLIVATALHFQVPLVTKDGLIRDWSGVPTIW